MTTPKFIVVKYPPAAAGKFLISLLMSSVDVAHYDPMIENNKTSENCIDYIKNSFTSNLKDWLHNEPKDKVAWNTSFFSNKYDRGNSLTLENFIEQAKETCTDHFHNSVKNNKLIPLVWHKTVTAPFFAESKILTILVDKESEKWHHRALWNKLYGVKNNRIHLKINDPDYNPTMKSFFNKFNNPIYSEESFYTFVKNNIVKNEFVDPFKNKNNIPDDVNQKIILLSHLLGENTFKKTIYEIFNFLGITPPDKKLIDFAYSHYAMCHNFKYSQNLHNYDFLSQKLQK